MSASATTRVGLVLSLVVTGAGCGGGSAADAEPAGGAVGAAAPPANSGTLAVGDKVFTFQVESCDLGDPPTPREDTVSGSGYTDDGQRLTVVVARDEGNRFIHHASLFYGQRTAGAGYEAVAIRARPASAEWPADKEGVGPSGPLVRIDGRTVRVEATFSVDDAGRTFTAPGRLEAVCPA